MSELGAKVRNWGSKVGRQKGYKLDRGALLIEDPPPAYFSTMHNGCFAKNRNLCIDWNSLLAQSGKMAIPFELMMQFKILQDLECPYKCHIVYIMINCIISYCFGLAAS